MLLEGNIHLSSDLRRLGFVKIFVFLTRPVSATYTKDLLQRYKGEVSNHRDDDQWLTDEERSRNFKGKGIGKKIDVVENNHLELAKSLSFLRSNNSWSRFGYLYASLYSDEAGTPCFFKPEKLQEILVRKGLVAHFELEEKVVFASALLTADIDGSASLLTYLLGEERGMSEIIGAYRNGILDTWYTRKKQFEPDPKKRYKYSQILKQKSSKIHFREQVQPRLQFMTDLDLVSGDGRFRLTGKGASLALALQISSAGDRSSEIVPLALRSEIHLWNEIVKLYSEGLGTTDKDQLDKAFVHASRFYARMGMILFSYENVFLATAATALRNGTSLDLSSFERYTAEMVSQKRIVVSDTGRREKYIKILR